MVCKYSKDLKTFAEKDFDPKKWINTAWSGAGNQEKEIFVANTVARLQLYMKQLSNSLDETATQIVSSIPRTLQEASSLQLEAALLQEQLKSLEQNVQGVEEQTGHSIKSLQKIDQLKTRLENAASSLREADKWVALAQSLEDTLDSGVPTNKEKLATLAEQVHAMTTSLEALSDSAEYESKRLQLTTLYNRLEAAISPPFMEALTMMDADRSSSYVSLFVSMSRVSSALRCWRRASAAARASRWTRLATHTPRAATHLLMDDAHAQVMEWLVSVVSCEAPLAELVRLHTDLLLSLDPSITKIVTAQFKLCQTPEDGLTYLTDLRADLDHYRDRVRDLLDSHKYNKEVVSEAALRELGVSLYSPLKALLPQYTELQTSLLLASLDDPALHTYLLPARPTGPALFVFGRGHPSPPPPAVPQADLLDYSRGLLTVCERSQDRLSSAYSKGRMIAGPAIYGYFAPAAESYLSSVLSLVSRHSRAVESSFLSCRSSSLSPLAPAALVLERAAALLPPVPPPTSDACAPPNILYDLGRLLSSGSAPSAPSLSAALQRTRDALNALSRNILRSPIDLQLDKIPQLSSWRHNDALSTELPDFALSPQEYITEVGQYLMTLPQHLELHLGDARAPWTILAELCTHTCEVYAQKILTIRNMDELGTKRCLTDIVYLSSVVEDLGSSITPALKNLENSLRAASHTHTQT
ncbi:putative component of oligomeric golgi complex 7 [Danaus plexippus plexippus]|uniref:Conserved oligomeric Golgi complex subunit 7 n=1 Tax=Danaus plexippus plexippus TaxID=278856 RepID=A0A212FLA1_DANPL|nr:putative component of oligomeric golgi complex 7 [Danaus plexippus plexippus]